MKKGFIYVQIGILIGLVVGCLPTRPVGDSSSPNLSPPSVPATSAATPSTTASSSPTGQSPTETASPNKPSPDDQLVAQQPECNNPQTQSEMNTCAAKSADLADTKLNETYQKLKETLQGSDADLLVSAQRAWIDFRDKNCQFSSGRFEGGSIAPLVYSSCVERVTKQRTQELEGYLRGVEQGGLY
ncbi:MAG TPA: lysozyme inhibitor LprI family protein [Crinalium sp.]